MVTGDGDDDLQPTLSKENARSTNPLAGVFFSGFGNTGGAFGQQNQNTPGAFGAAANTGFGATSGGTSRNLFYHHRHHRSHCLILRMQNLLVSPDVVFLVPFPWPSSKNIAAIA